MLGLGWIGSLISGATEISKELIDTPLEKAQAQILKIQSLDPNGKMRRDLAKFASRAFGFYLLVVSMLVLSLIFKVENVEAIKFAISEMADLFIPITAAWTAIVSASFGVNITNNIKDIKMSKS